MWVNKLKVGTLIKPQAHSFCFIRSQDFLEAGAVCLTQVEHIDWQIKYLQPWFMMMLEFIIIVSSIASCRKLVFLGMGKSWKSRFHLWLCEIRLWQHVTYLTAARDTCLSVPELTITDVEPGRGGATCPPSAPPTNASTRLFLWVLLAVLLSPAIKNC